ncbi:MAG TPA: FHA domain-containing protein, partial [Candidatus Methanomethylicus sp.]|nr:FHA domain-containing protein [Candidatus Methanomethylicus sp.]
QALKSAGIGLVIGLVGCCIGGIVAQLVYSGILSASGQISLGSVMLARTIGWGIAGSFLGLGQGVAMMSGKKVLNGFLGGMGGGAIGGLLFDPIAMVTGEIQQGLISRLVGLILIGGMAGLLMGIVEYMLKDAWLRVEQGFLAGKQFVIYKNPTVIGSSPKCHIYLFKDPAIEPQHAAVHMVGNQYEIEDLRSREGTFVNNVPVARRRLQDRDQIRVGQTVFHYFEKKRGAR